MAEPTVATLDVRDMTPLERHPTTFDRLVQKVESGSRKAFPFFEE